jgi:hypothetical protein
MEPATRARVERLARIWKVTLTVLLVLMGLVFLVRFGSDAYGVGSHPSRLLPAEIGQPTEHP